MAPGPRLAVARPGSPGRPSRESGGVVCDTVHTTAIIPGKLRSDVSAHRAEPALTRIGSVVSNWSPRHHDLRSVRTNSASARGVRCRAGFAERTVSLPRLPPMRKQRESSSAPVHRSRHQPRVSGLPLSLPFLSLQLGRKSGLRDDPPRSAGGQDIPIAKPHIREFRRAGPSDVQRALQEQRDEVNRASRQRLAGLYVRSPR